MPRTAYHPQPTRTANPHAYTLECAKPYALALVVRHRLALAWASMFACREPRGVAWMS